MQRRSRVLRVVSTVLSSALVASYATTGVGAFSVEQDFPSGQTVYYRLDQTVRNRGNDAILAVYAGDQAWEAHDLRQWTDLVNNDSLGGNRVVKFDPIDGPGDIRAQTWPLGCLATSPSCELEFDSGENWCYRTGDPGSRPDLRGVAAHEFGHWIGLDHSGGATGCPSPDFLASDNNAYPTMTACYQSSNPDLRTISQDDVNGFHVARQGSPLPTANDSFEYTASTYGWGYVAERWWRGRAHLRRHLVPPLLSRPGHRGEHVALPRHGEPWLGAALALPLREGLAAREQRPGERDRRRVELGHRPGRQIQDLHDRDVVERVQDGHVLALERHEAARRGLQQHGYEPEPRPRQPALVGGTR